MTATGTNEIAEGPAPAVIEPTSTESTSMGGRLVIHVDAPARGDAARADSERVIARVNRWASRLTRHTDTSDLARLNSDERGAVPVRPLLAAALVAGMTAAEASEGFADITLLDARLAAEGLGDRALASRLSEWQLIRRHRGVAVIRRTPGLHFDLGGVAKGWIADRAVEMLAEWPSAVVDADGDLAIRCAPGRAWEIGIEDPRTPDTHLAVLRLSAPAGGSPERWGVATSGTSVHRWNVGGTVTHHLIDPRTGRPAETDVIQATEIGRAHV
jgi:thiamine biosynthesis lipoprotein